MISRRSHESDCVWILKEIKGITYRFEGQCYIYLSLNNARTSYYAYTQGAEDSISSYPFIKRADSCRFGTLWANFEYQFSRGNDQYPTNLTAAYSLLVNFKPPKRDKPHWNPRSQDPAVEEEDGIIFMQAGEVIAGADGVTHRRHYFYASWRSDCRR